MEPHKNSEVALPIQLWCRIPGKNVVQVRFLMVRDKRMACPGHVHQLNEREFAYGVVWREPGDDNDPGHVGHMRIYYYMGT